MIQLTNTIINSSIGLSSGTYVVEDTITLSQDLTIPEDVTLVFQGGKFTVAEGCTEEITIYGSNTRLEAPICTIFGKGINMEGSWDIDRAYPQWFDGDRDINNNEIIDYSPLINKAITMKKSGEVFLKAGTYNIHNSIIMGAGITLCGERGQGNDNSTEITLNGFNGNYVAYVNSKTDINQNGKVIEEAIVNHIGQNTILKNLVFRADYNSIHDKCILAGSGVHFDYIHWYYFKQCIKYVGVYNDCKRITNCSLNCDGKSDTNNDNIYAIDASWLGDAFIFEHNALHQTITGKALRIDHCGGASIQGNIINGDIEIACSKAIVFNANHCEGGKQVEIVDSSVVTNNNYFHRGERPNYYIHSSGNSDECVVSLQNDMFVQLQHSNNNNNNNNNNFYDINIDKYTTLKISNVYRYDATAVDFGKMYTYGINIQKADETSLADFNNYSYIASRNSEIGANYSINLSHTIKNVNSPHIYAAMQSGIGWYLTGATYRYYYQIVWDKNRNIKKTATNSSKCIFPIQWYNSDGSTSNSNFILSNSKGGLLAMLEDACGNCSMVRLIREKVTGDPNLNNLEFEAQEVYVPMCGNRVLYDNGISVCGYKWSEPFTFNLQETCDKDMEMFRIIDSNVECFTKREGGITPTAGWKRGDVIHNIGNNPSTYIMPEDIV